MFERIAVVGTGVIGTLAGGFLSMAGRDVTMVSIYRRAVVDVLNEKGVRINLGQECYKPSVKARFMEDLTPEEDIFDLVILSGKSNDTEVVVKKFLPLLSEHGVLMSMQNGINDDLIASLAGRQRVVPCVCFTGGALIEPGVVDSHDGRLVVGELDGTVTPRVQELSEIMSAIKPTTVSDNIMQVRWGKLALVSGGPITTVSGYHLFGGNSDWRMLRLKARVHCEAFAVARACGYPLEKINILTETDAKILAVRDDKRINAHMKTDPMAKAAPPPGAVGLSALVDSYTADIRKGLPLEAYSICGYIIDKGREMGVPTPTHEVALEMLRQVERKELPARKENLDTMIRLTDPYFVD